MSIGRNITILCFDKKVTSHALAEAAGVSDSMISKIISGDKKAPLEVAVAIAKALGTTVDELIK